VDYKRIREAKELAIALPIALTASTNDECPAFILQYVPKNGTEGTAATVTLVQGGDVTFQVDSAAPSGADAIGTDGVIDSSAGDYNTVGEFCNEVNGTRAWRAICLVDPSTPMANILAKSATSCLTDNGLVFYLDTSVVDTTYIWSIPFTGEAFENYGKAGHKKDDDDKCVNSFILAGMTQDFGSAATAYLKVFEQGDTSATEVLSKSLSDNSLTEWGNTDAPNDPFYTAPEGYTLVLEIRSDAATAFSKLRAVGKTVVRKNNRVVRRYPHVAA